MTAEPVRTGMIFSKSAYSKTHLNRADMNQRMIIMISREEAIKHLHHISGFIFDVEWKEALDMAIEALSAERPKGRWLPVWHGEFIATLECSACGRRINVDYPLMERTIKRKYPYCHCGADMRDGEEE